MTKLPDSVMIWHSNPELTHLGTWATTRYPEEAVEYVPKDAFGPASQLISDAWAEAQKAMRNFPQPNYVISKVAEEAGEVVKAAIHCAEGRETKENVISEIKQAMAMLMRLYIEGDQVHGLNALRDPVNGGE
ncbi:hypothetical protein OE699_01810 [Sedimentimonas flavescens]|uniref:Uncharacterized protein n=1 Tax=Sedimentimonas flavescens TaxID=2851012 RepID=A0ABT2ZV02_9RHOB|nr:hypothetical protein [Sedimentimonas flavescens]MCV2877574.1 hypothetical protein [Sedimentimonas flavescens]